MFEYGCVFVFPGTPQNNWRAFPLVVLQNHLKKGQPCKTGRSRADLCTQGPPSAPGPSAPGPAAGGDGLLDIFSGGAPAAAEAPPMVAYEKTLREKKRSVN